MIEIAGSGSQIALDLQRLNECMDDADPVDRARRPGRQPGQDQDVGDGWLLASVRNQRQDRARRRRHPRQHRLHGRGRRGEADRQDPQLPPRRHPLSDPRRAGLSGDHRGLARRSTPPTGAARSRSAPSIRPSDIRAGLYVDAMLGKHFALLGSTGTGKSTSAALILHRICESAPQGHIVMIDPHGEYSAAFRNTGIDLRRRQPADAVLADELRGALRGVPDHQRQRPRRKMPTSSPSACSRRAARTGWPRRSARSPSIRRSPTCSAT